MNGIREFKTKGEGVSKILVVVSHPDDESFWCGGTIATAVKKGEEVTVVTLTDGVGSRDDYTDGGQSRRRAHFVAACRVLGAACTFDEQLFDDQKSDGKLQLDINKAVHRVVQSHRPDVVYTHWVGDLNLDHRRTAEAVLVATRPGTYQCQVFAMTPEYPSRCVGPKFEPNVTVDISDVLETKLKACQCYTDEMRWYPHPRSERAILEQTTEQFYAYD